MKTERVTLLISPAEKAALSARAEALGMPISELMRRAALAFDPDREGSETHLAALTAELEVALVRLRPKLNEAHAEAAATRRYLADREAQTAAVRAALEGDAAIEWGGIESLFGLSADALAPAAERVQGPPPSSGNGRSLSLADIARRKMRDLAEPAAGTAATRSVKAARSAAKEFP